MNARVGLAYGVKLLGSLVVGVHNKWGPELVLTKSFNGPSGRTSLEFKDGPVSLVLMCDATDGGDRANRRIISVLLEGNAGAVTAGIGVQSELTRSISGSVPIREDDNGRVSGFSDDGFHENLRVRTEDERCIPFHRTVNGV